jgi:hypothetical protein
MSYLANRLMRGAALLALALSAACTESTNSSEPGRLSILLTDAPGDFVHAVVTIDQIYLQPGEGDGGRIVLRDEDVTTDLLTLANSTASLVSEAVVPAGSYSQLRFVISGAYIEVENADGTTSIYATSPSYAGLPVGADVDGDLQMPSFAQSGLKVKLPGDAMNVAGGDKILLVDFDVSRSFGKQAGNSGKWVMTPVLEATEFAMTSNLTVTVTKADTVTFPQINAAAVTLANFQAVLKTAAGSEEALPLTDANGDGTFEAPFRFLAPGAYTLDLRAPSDSVVFTTNPARPVAVTVGTGSQAQALVVTSARK